MDALQKTLQDKPKSLIILFSGGEGSTFFIHTLGRIKGITVLTREPLDNCHDYAYKLTTRQKLKWLKHYIALPLNAKPQKSAQNYLSRLRGLNPDLEFKKPPYAKLGDTEIVATKVRYFSMPQIPENFPTSKKILLQIRNAIHYLAFDFSLCQLAKKEKMY